MAYDRDKFFANIGKRIAVWYEYEDLLDQLELAREQQITLLDDTEDEGDWLTTVLATYTEHKDLIADMRAGVVADVKQYLLTGVRADLGVTERDLMLVIDELEDQMLLAADCVLENIETHDQTDDENICDPDNQGTARLTYGAEVGQERQFFHDDMDFEIECYDISAGAGSEYWRVRRHAKGEPTTVAKTVGTAQTGVEFSDKPTGENKEDEFYGLRFTINYNAAIQEFNDNLNQLSNWVLNDVVKSRADMEEDEGDTDYYGQVYVELTDAAGTRTVDLYKDAAKTILVATGSGGDGVINLVAQAGYSINGSVTVAYAGDDLDIYLILPFAPAIGDKIKFSTSVWTRGLFQYFFVENFDRALPACVAGNETVSETFARGNRMGKIWIPAGAMTPMLGATPFNVGDFDSLRLDAANETVNFNLLLPDDCIIKNATFSLAYIAQANVGADDGLDVRTDGGAPGEPYTTHSDALAGVDGGAKTAFRLYKVDLSAAFYTALKGDLYTPGDFIGVEILANADAIDGAISIFVIGFLVEW